MKLHKFNVRHHGPQTELLIKAWLSENNVSHVDYAVKHSWIPVEDIGAGVMRNVNAFRVSFFAEEDVPILFALHWSEHLV